MSTKAQYFPANDFMRRRATAEGGDAAAAEANSSAARKDVLLGQEFLNRLRVEKLRADRSKMPLSIALFHPGPGCRGGEVHHLLSHLASVTRETDIKGLTDAETVGLLLPDTGEKGVQICLEKILRTNGRVPCSVVSATYPDRLFEAVLNQAQGRPEPVCLDIPAVPPYRFRRGVKRVLDIAGALVAIILFMPLMLAAAAAIKLTSPGPVLFKQNRLGWRGKRFSCCKFRSMYCDSDDRTHREFVTNYIQGRLEKVNQGEGKTPFYKMKNDPRITPVGRILRKLSLDELPQLFNVLKGDMSLVGPRPPLAYEVEKYEPWHVRRILEAKPGVTGLWQVNGRNQTTFEEMVRLDLRYARTWSLWLDFKILVKTCREILHPRGVA